MTRNKLIDKLKENFKIQELVCSHCYNKFKDGSWLFLSTEILSTLHTLRYKIFNCPIVINTWSMNGTLSQRGLRCNRCSLVRDKKSIYLSAHLLGKALDLRIEGYTVKEAYDKIKDNIDKFEYPIRLESNTSTWLHIDTIQPVDSEADLIEFKG